jgi:hypothetical protein
MCSWWFTTEGGSCISASPPTPPRSGLPSNSATRFPGKPRPAISCEIAIGSSATNSRSKSRTSAYRSTSRWPRTHRSRGPCTGRNWEPPLRYRKLAVFTIGARRRPPQAQPGVTGGTVSFQDDCGATETVDFNTSAQAGSERGHRALVISRLCCDPHTARPGPRRSLRPRT